MGEIVGMAASVCKKRDTDPRGVYDRYFTDLQEIMRRGVGKNPEASPNYENQGEGKSRVAPTKAVTVVAPEWLKSAGASLARSARVTVSGSRDKAKSPDAVDRWQG